jgi:peptidoglycan/LPS O-acetylase OafA/YrhL
MTARAGRFPLFDSLRAIAALSVLVTHGAFYAGALGDGSAVRPYAARLDCGVTIFFLISGFLLYRPFAVAHIRGEPAPAAGPYAWRRFLRIVPAYWVALTIITIWFSHDEVFTAAGIPTYYGLAQAYRGSGAVLGGISQAWTLSVEVAFYVFLPIWAAGLRAIPRRRGGRLGVEVAAICALGVLSLLYTTIVVATGDPDQVDFARAELLTLPSYLDQFALGMLLAVASVALERREEQPGIVRVVDRFPALAWACALGAFLLVSRGVGLTGAFGEPFTPFQYVERHVLYAVVAFFLIVPAVFGDQRRGVVRRWVLGNPVLLYLGMISYGIYLWHQAVFGQLVKWDWASVDFIHPYVTWLLAGVAGTALIATVSWYVVERPILSLKRLVPDPRRRTSAPVPATPRAAAERS